MNAIKRIFITLYVTIGLFMGATMYAAMPALNLAGAIYYGAVWPAWPLSNVLGVALAPIPSWAFTLESGSCDGL